MAVLLVALAYAAAYALVPLLVVLPHELGHALVARAVGVREITVEVGAEPRRWRVALRRLTVHMRLFNRWRWLWYGTVLAEGDVTRWGRVAVAGAGPLVTAVLVFAYAAAGTATQGFVRWFFWALMFAAAWSFLVTALPIRYGRFFGPYAGRVSDGYRIRQALGKS